MAATIQVALDCADPHRQCAFWAATLGYDVEEVEPGIRQAMEAGFATDDDVATVDGRLVWKTAAACRDPQGVGPRMYFQLVPEAKVVKNRVHVDVRVVAGARDGEVARLVALGATKLYDGRQGPETWVTMADPEGNEFCLT
jgi:hypothetical protein